MLGAARRAGWPNMRLKLAGLSLFGARSKEEPMRYAMPLIATALAMWGTRVRAQSIIRPHPLLLASAPSFQAPIFRSRPLAWARFRVDTLLASAHTCPMPVVRTDSANEDPMPVARAQGPLEPMPVAPSGCSNPLDHRPANRVPF